MNINNISAIHEKINQGHTVEIDGVTYKKISNGISIEINGEHFKTVQKAEFFEILKAQH
jgi:hypothetical protein